MKRRSLSSVALFGLMAILPGVAAAGGTPGNLGQCMKSGEVGTPHGDEYSSVGKAGGEFIGPAAYLTVSQNNPNGNPPVAQKADWWEWCSKPER